MKINKQSLLHNLELTSWALVIIGVVGFLLEFGNSYFNVNTQHFIDSQYQDRQHSALVTQVNTRRLNFTTNLANSPLGQLTLHPTTRQKLTRVQQLLALREDNQRQIAHYYDGNYYANQVTTPRLNQTDRNLLKEKNQTIYQREKNRIDTIRIWYDQTQDAKTYLNKNLAKTISSKQLTMTKASTINTYYKLIKNRALKKYWRPKVTKALKEFKAAQQNQTQAQIKQQQAELKELKNAPLTQDYQPANVTIIDNAKQLDQVSHSLQQDDVNATNVLFYSNADQTLTLLQRNGGKYLPKMASLMATNNGLPTGTYSVKSLISDPGINAGVVTDLSSSSFGNYLEDATSYSEQDNTISDFNQAETIFWLKNNVALKNSMLIENQNQIGFIASSMINLNNTLTLSTSDLTRLMAVVTPGTVLYVR